MSGVRQRLIVMESFLRECAAQADAKDAELRRQREDICVLLGGLRDWPVDAIAPPVTPETIDKHKRLGAEIWEQFREQQSISVAQILESLPLFALISLRWYRNEALAHRGESKK